MSNEDQSEQLSGIQSLFTRHFDIVSFFFVLAIFAAASYYFLENYFFGNNEWTHSYLGFLSAAASSFLDLVGFEHRVSSAWTIVYKDMLLTDIGSATYIDKRDTGFFTISVLVFGLLIWGGSIVKRMMAAFVSIVIMIAASILGIALELLVDHYLPLHSGWTTEWMFPVAYVLLAAGLFLVFTSSDQSTK